MSETPPQVRPDRFVWPAVVLFMSCLASVVAILLFVPETNSGGQQAVIGILGMLGSAISGVFVLARVTTMQRDVAEVKDQVNGRMSALIQAKTLPGNDSADAGQS